MSRADAYNDKICTRALLSPFINVLGSNHVLCMENMENHDPDDKCNVHRNCPVEDAVSIFSRMSAYKKVESFEEETLCPICFDFLQPPILRPSDCNHYFVKTAY
ncbi:unnamed protein product [Rodentolepis nana]|uniref:RING-type domain-containing protein n=1 Tax=Rodentolepis nana TaxID=102285 RepID=A0A0R3TGN4_RODNA|nr:unnamed protein product [Rodentolepis nana]